jgi:hypothetical protein
MNCGRGGVGSARRQDFTHGLSGANQLSGTDVTMRTIPMPAAYDLAPAVEEGFRTCGTTYGCFEVAVASVLLFVAWAGLSTFVLFSPHVNIRAAVAAIDDEYGRVEDEQTALSRFAQRLSRISTAQPMAAQANAVGNTVQFVERSGAGGGMADVRRAYEETVMAVDHYEEDYNEPLPEHLASEFGENVAGTVVASSDLSPQLKQALVSGCQEGRAQRDQYLEGLRREETQLEQMAEQFERAAALTDEVDGQRLRRRPFEDLQDRLDRLDTQRAAVATTLDDRQKHLQEGVRFGWERRDADSVYRYLYEDLDVTYPVLADGTRLLDHMRDVEHRLLTALTART